MLSKEGLARIVRDEVENEIRNGEEPVGLYYILLNGEIYPINKYDKEVAEGKRSVKDIYAYVEVYAFVDFDDFLFHINYIFSDVDIVFAYLRKVSFIINYFGVLSPALNLKYFIYAGIKRDKDRKPEYLVVSVYDIDSIARSLHIPQIVEQRLGSQPREITADELSDIEVIVTNKQPLLAGHTYRDAHDILYGYYVDHKKKYKDEVYKIDLAYSQLFPTPYRVCYEWKMEMFVETSCLKIVLRSFSS